MLKTQLPEGPAAAKLSRTRKVSKMRRSVWGLCLAIIAILVGGCKGPERMRVGVLQAGSEQSIHSAMEWVDANRDFEAFAIDPDAPSIPPVDLLWLYLPDETSHEAANPNAEKLANWLATRFESGTPVLLTGYAALLPYRMGLETQPPEIRSDTLRGTDWFFTRKRGLQSLFGHPAFAGLSGGSALYDPGEETAINSVGYFGDVWPNPGRVVAVEKRYITVDKNRKLMVEYGEGPVRLLTIGGFVKLDGENLLRANLDQFLRNVMLDLATPNPLAERSYWRRSDGEVSEVSVDPQPLPIPREEPVIASYSGLRINVEHPGDDPWDLAGRRVLVVGKERGGIDEVWTHPVRTLKDYRAGILREGVVHWLDETSAKLAIRPESLERTWELPEGTLRETVVAALQAPGGYARYELEGDPIQLVVQFHSDLRWMWPYDSDALGGLRYAINKSTGALHVSDARNHFQAIIGADLQPETQLAGPYSTLDFTAKKVKGIPGGRDVAYGASYRLGGEQPSELRIAFAGGFTESDDIPSVFSSLITRPGGILEEQVEHVRDLLNNSVQLETPDAEFDRLWRWALVGTDRFWTTTPGLGTALVAGFGNTARGWDGGQEVSGRPGYAWYFGRDAVWSAFAIDAYGDVANVRKQLEFLQSFQNPQGMIFHELTTSGVAHYDAADATPLYVMLMAHYVRASGDQAFLRSSWPHIERAMDFLFSSDANEDGLIDNINVGHGWVEGGALWGAQSSFYLSGLWQRCLADASYLAGLTGKSGTSRHWSAAADAIRDRLHTEFYNDSKKTYRFALLPDGSFNEENTVMTAPVACFGELEDSTMTGVLNDWAGVGFSSDWGLRMLSTESESYSRSAYHAGTVWPLFTGWTSLAEFRYGRTPSAFTHMMENLRIKKFWADGFIEEVMNGDVYEPAGVCWHQCWSETNVLHPGIEGMIGWAPDAPHRRATLTPRFPLQWDSVTVRNLRISDTVLDFHMERQGNRISYRLERKEGRPVPIYFAPELPEGSVITVAWSNGLPITVSNARRRGVLADPVVLHTDVDAELILQLRGGIGVVPLVPASSPGQRSEGFRIVNAQLQMPVYAIELEGPSGSTTQLRLRNYGKPIENVLGARIVEENNGWVTLVVELPAGPTPFVRKTVNVLINR